MKQIMFAVLVGIFSIIIFGYFFNQEADQVKISINFDEIHSKIESFKNEDLFNLKYTAELPITPLEHMDKSAMKHKVEAYLTNLQGLIVGTLQKFELKEKFMIDRIMHPNVSIKI
jgi:hypothetical protein